MSRKIIKILYTRPIYLPNSIKMRRSMSRKFFSCKRPAEVYTTKASLCQVESDKCHLVCSRHSADKVGRSSELIDMRKI